MEYVRKLIDDYCVLDLETTGLEPDFCKIIEVGILKINSGKVVEEYNTLINPDEIIDPYITELTGITNDMVKDAPRIEDVVDNISDFLSDNLIVGHNTSFDLKFLKRYMTITNEYTDTLQFSRKVFPELEHHRLSDLRKYFNLSKNNHRALSDCYTTFELYELIKKTHGEKKVDLTNYLLYKKLICVIFKRMQMNM